MARLKISENLFLEKNELNNLVKFITEDGYKRLIKPLISHWGIVKDEYNTYFKVIKDGNNILVNSGIAFNADADAIINNEQREITLSNSPLGTKKWVILSRDVTNLESGVVNIAADGSMVGFGTEFTKVLRGQPNFPVKVSFAAVGGETLDPTLEGNTYEVVRVIDDNNALLAGEFAPQNDLRYAVVGTFTPGFIPTEENAYIYEYDSCRIEVVESASRPEVEDGMEFILACVEYINNGIVVSDERENAMFNEVNENTSYENVAENNIASIRSANIVSGLNSDAVSCDIELCVEHSFYIDEFTVDTSSDDTILRIAGGHNKLLGNNPTLSDGMFNGWIVLNRSNMKTLKIIENLGNDLYINTYYDSFLSNDSTDEVIIIPPFDEVEYEVLLNKNVKEPAVPFYFRRSIEDAAERLRFYCMFENSVINTSNQDIAQIDETTLRTNSQDSSTIIKVRYRYIKNGSRYAFRNFAQHSFKFQGITRIYNDGQFSIKINDFKPEAQNRNYS